jgi:hypothetical protein
MNFSERAMYPREGVLEIIVQDFDTKEIIRHDVDHNQLQDWARHAFAHLGAGRLFSTWGNHGEPVTDIGPYTLPYTIAHYQDGRDGSTSGDIQRASPWTYSSALEGLVLTRKTNGLDDELAVPLDGSAVYPFFPTKMRFGTGGLDDSQNPKVNIPTSSTDLQSVEIIYPFVTIDRTRSLNSHITVESSNPGSSLTNNKITFSCKLPGGAGNYPYNGLVISEAGLYCDAGMIVNGSDTTMRTGTMLAYRSFYGITKNASIDVTFKWSLTF